MRFSLLPPTFLPLYLLVVVSTLLCITIPAACAFQIRLNNVHRLEAARKTVSKVVRITASTTPPITPRVGAAGVCVGWSSTSPLSRETTSRPLLLPSMRLAASSVRGEDNEWEDEEDDEVEVRRDVRSSSSSYGPREEEEPRVVKKRTEAKTKTVGGSASEQELKRIAIEEDEEFDDEGGLVEEDDYYYEEEEYSAPVQRRQQGRPKMKRYEEYDEYYYDDDDDEYDDYYYYEEEEEYDEDGTGAAGNYWTNPKRSLDPYPSEGGQQRRGGADYGYMPRSTANPRRRSDGERRKRTEELYGRPPPRQRTTFRSGTPPPPRTISNFYNRLFWYGFDSTETTSSSDRTMFGGTKGKFHGLDLLRDAYEEKYDDKRRRNEEEDYWEREGEYWEEEDDEGDFDSVYRRQASFSLPSSSETVRRRPPSAGSGGGQRQRRRRRRSGDDDGGRRDWVSGEVSSWFDASDTTPMRGRYEEEEDDDFYDDYDYDLKRRRSKEASGGVDRRRKRQGRPSPQRRQRQEEDSSWNGVTDILDNIFNVDAEEMERKAKEYDMNLGLDRGRKKRVGRQSGAGENGSYYDEDDDDDDWEERNRRRARTRPRRGYAYRYTDDDGMPPVADVEIVRDDDDDDDDQMSSAKEDEEEKEVTAEHDSVVSKQQPDEEEEEPNEQPPKRTSNGQSTTASSRRQRPRQRRSRTKKRTWEDRASDVERVPPRGVTAWGPNGEITTNENDNALDVRTQAALLAMEEIRDAKRLLESREEKCIDMEERVIVLKADADLQKKRLYSLQADNAMSRSEVRIQLRRLSLRIEDAARSLRTSRKEVEVALCRVEELEERHWALLSRHETDVETFEEDRVGDDVDGGGGGVDIENEGKEKKEVGGDASSVGDGRIRDEERD